MKGGWNYWAPWETKKYRAKHWGLKHGYYGMPGGWIYKEGDTGTTKWHGHDVQKPVCHGWEKLYNMKANKIERWRKAKGLPNRIDKND